MIMIVALSLSSMIMIVISVSSMVLIAQSYDTFVDRDVSSFSSLLSVDDAPIMSRYSFVSRIVQGLDISCVTADHRHV